ncbi:valyl-tRNA synthetase [Archaeoglobus sulfaticallidus PM70-1]|uniref:Valine--tRNA ligase n=1 Tax=Archaeoglobus sulfaticallidus PM70-1 TaxID=387631 RepID=N0BJM7_9EURY|nr:valine--tRNA ligase [Archaeoglobus sulfaticallidus]AGK60696.1 valyl-tRNA synthetase [Archaeoglobus sulfaticallidus PM70-1]
MEEIEKEYRALEIEKKWLNLWDESMYYFDWNSRKPHYIIDTPPPYPTGSFHIGNTLNWCYIDFIARYKRMRGYEVMFPQGWDCHGLPTEVKVEEKHGISKNDVPRDVFRKMCVEFTEGNIKKMRETMKRMGFSIDWSNEYITMYPEYFKKTQISFVRMYDKGLIYRAYHPVIHCPRCQTTIALAEIEYKSGKTMLNYIKFDEDVVIATTRPELIPACVALAVHPDDERYKNIVGKEVTVPTTEYKVRVIADEEVDPEFGTGIVMICTFGDRQDVKWWKKHDLELRMILDRDGRLNEKAGRYQGLSIREARQKILEDLEKEGRVLKKEEIDHNVGTCWRCKTPVEIIAEEQWFVRIEHDRILDGARKIKWIPEHMFSRLVGWVEGMEWDWVISRQRIFATPIPAWYCKKCGEILVAKEEWLPVDPTKDYPKIPCPSCGSVEFVGEDDVLDTWMDSSITPLAITGWPYEHKEYPTHLRPQGHDIIRTWAFYTILRSLALADEIPWYEIVINGMVLGEDGRKMSKSLGNIISPEEVIEKYGADALRQWAASGSTGSDVIFTWKEVVSASRFQQKFWSILRFSVNHLKGYKPDSKDAEKLRLADRWILSKLNRVIEKAINSMDSYRFDETLKAIRGFAWYDLADDYLEIVKSRLYSGSEEEKVGAKYALYKTISALIRMLAPFTPFLAEECWNIFCKATESGNESVHKQSYPEVEEEFIDDDAEERGELMRRIISEIRKLKHDRNMALNAPLKSVMIYTEKEIDTRDIAGAVNSKVEILKEFPSIETRIKQLKPKYSIIGPKFRDKAKEIIKAVNSFGEKEMRKLLEEGYEIEVNGEKIFLEKDWFDAVEERVFAGKDVQVLEVEGVIVLVEI